MLDTAIRLSNARRIYEMALVRVQLEPSILVAWAQVMGGIEMWDEASWIAGHGCAPIGKTAGEFSVKVSSQRPVFWWIPEKGMDCTFYTLFS